MLDARFGDDPVEPAGCLFKLSSAHPASLPRFALIPRSVRNDKKSAPSLTLSSQLPRSARCWDCPAPLRPAPLPQSR